MNMVARRHTKELIRKHKPSIVVLVEARCLFSRAANFWDRLGYSVSGVSEEMAIQEVSG